MKRETKIRNALITLYWQAHDDGRICSSILEHIRSKEWAERRADVINKALQELGLSDKDVEGSVRPPRRF